MHYDCLKKNENFTYETPTYRRGSKNKASIQLSTLVLKAFYVRTNPIYKSNSVTCVSVRVSVCLSVCMSQLIGTRIRKKQNSKFSSQENYVRYNTIRSERKLYFRIFKNLNLRKYLRTYIRIYFQFIRPT